MTKHDPSRWGDKLWAYYPIDYSPDRYHNLTSWWLDKIPLLGNAIMEVGCWSALSIIWLKGNFPEKDIIGIEINGAVVHAAKTRVYYHGVDVPIYCEDGFRLVDFKDQSKDIIYHDGLAEHFDEEDRTKLLNEHLRVAEQVLFLVPTVESFVEGTGYGDERWESKEYWKQYTEKNFKIIEILNHPEGTIGFLIKKKQKDVAHTRHPEEYHFTKMRNLVGNREIKKVLDVGCGTGYLASFFLDCSECIHAVDRRQEDIETARIKYPTIHFEQEDLEKYHLTGEYDFIIFSDVIYYLTPTTQDRIMHEIYNVLTPDGVLLTSRHMGKGDQEIDQYRHLFEPIKTERIQNIETSSYWQATLWRKKKKQEGQ